MSQVDCSKYTVYEKNNGNFIDILSGLKINDNSLYKWISYNRFEDQPTIIPKGYKERKQKKTKQWLELVNNYYCGNKIVLTIENKHLLPIISHPNYKYYYIHDNGGRPFLVYISNNDIYIYKNPDNIIFSNQLYDLHEDTKWMYSQLIKHYLIQEYFIGHSPKNAMTKYSGGYGKDFTGNSILIKIKNHEYIYIGSEIYSFTSKTNIIRFVSPVGNNDVPYPYAIDSNNNYYLMLHTIMIQNIPKNIDPYTYYYKKQTISKAYPISKNKNNYNNITGFYILPIDINHEISLFNKNNKNNPKYTQRIIALVTKLDFTDTQINDIKKHNTMENDELLEIIREIYFEEHKYNLNYDIKPTENYNRLQKTIGKYIYIEIDGKKKTLSKNDYIKLLEEYNKTIGIQFISNIKMIQNRL